MEISHENTIGGMVAKDYRTATVFASFGIDFCCRGNHTLEEACERKAIDPLVVKEALDEVTLQPEGECMDFNFWPLDLLADYIEKKHHRYVEERIPLLVEYLNKLCQVHGEPHAELFQITALFTEAAGELVSHMKKEELVLFPHIRKMMKKSPSGFPSEDDPNFRTVKLPIKMMMQDHEREGDRFEKIASLTNQFRRPADACNTYRVTYALLDEFQSDLHKHIHLENNILFPKAIEQENYHDF